MKHLTRENALKRCTAQLFNTFRYCIKPLKTGDVVVDAASHEEKTHTRISFPNHELDMKTLEIFSDGLQKVTGVVCEVLDGKLMFMGPPEVLNAKTMSPVNQYRIGLEIAETMPQQVAR